MKNYMLSEKAKTELGLVNIPESGKIGVKWDLKNITGSGTFKGGYEKAFKSKEDLVETLISFIGFTLKGTGTVTYSVKIGDGPVRSLQSDDTNKPISKEDIMLVYAWICGNESVAQKA